MKAKDRIEVQKSMGKTEVVLEGFTGLGLICYEGGPRDARRFAKQLAEVVQSILDEKRRPAR
jgi:hypothetical protein